MKQKSTPVDDDQRFSVRDCIRTIASTPAAYRAIRREAAKNGTSSLTIREIDREIAAHRRQAKKSPNSFNPSL